uniref:Uncharacterized protein n=1 Tax=Mycena chlorophos TaxID=658473 RepID=A0ABQ0KU47_MYCCL|nr:predicted protein [Mycena chlorophos]
MPLLLNAHPLSSRSSSHVNRCKRLTSKAMSKTHGTHGRRRRVPDFAARKGHAPRAVFSRAAESALKQEVNVGEDGRASRPAWCVRLFVKRASPLTHTASAVNSKALVPLCPPHPASPAPRQPIQHSAARSDTALHLHPHHRLLAFVYHESHPDGLFVLHGRAQYERLRHLLRDNHTPQIQQSKANSCNVRGFTFPRLLNALVNEFDDVEQARNGEGHAVFVDGHDGGWLVSAMIECDTVGGEEDVNE